MDQGAQIAAGTTVARFQNILLWPIHLVAAGPDGGVVDHARRLLASGGQWRLVDDEITGDPAAFQERHYTEFVTFLPTVQRLLYGEGRRRRSSDKEHDSPITVLRRDDIAAVRIVLAPDTPPVVLSIVHVDLYFFYDVDVAMLVVEVSGCDLPLHTVQDVLFRFGRSFPAFWTEDGRAGHCPHRVEWLAGNGSVLAASDYEARTRYLEFVSRHRSPAVAAHWSHLLKPLVLDHSDEDGAIRYRQLEYYRMPVMAYVALADAATLSRSDRMRLALGIGPGEAEGAIDSRALDDLEDRHLYRPSREVLDGRDWAGTWHAVAGNTFVVGGAADNPFFTDPERGYLGRFRHQHFLAFLIAHFHRASLLMFSEDLADAVGRLEVGKPADRQHFRAESREALERFLRFTHRYWFREIANQVQTHALFDLCRRRLQVERLYAEVRQELQDMSQLLEGEAQRRQNASMVRLTVVTTFGLIGTVTTGFLGMNLFAMEDMPAPAKIGALAAVLLPSLALTLFTVVKSARLSEFLDVLSDESARFRDKTRAFRRIW